jgi:hypothetical protein
VRRLAAFLTLVALVLASAAVAAGEQDPRAEQVRLNARDTRLAAAVALTKRDLGRGWNASRVPKSAGPACKSFAPDLSKFTITGKAHTMFADSRGSSVQSVVEVYPNKAQAEGDFLAAAKPGQAHCLREALAHAQRQAAKGVRLRFESARMLAAPKVGQRAAAYRLRGSLGSNGVSFPLFMDLLVVHRGRTLVAFFFTGLERPVAGQLKLARKVAERMR